MTPNQPGPGGASVGFAERLLEVIDSGRRTATYKLALLIALLDLCASHSDTGGRAPGLLYTREIAEQVAALYWPQVIPYLVPGAGTAVELRQITLPRAAIIGAVSTFRRAAVAAGAASWHLARQRLPGPYQVMLDQVEVIVAEQPLPRLQAVGSSDTVFPFLYELGWGPRESFSPARLRRHGPRGAAVRLLPGAGDELLRLGPLVRPLVELHWTRMVAEINQVATAELDLHRHLFGSDRVLPPRPLRDGVAALQTAGAFTATRSSAPRQRPITSCRGSAAASTPSRTWCWPTGGATTTNATCSPGPRTWLPGPAATSATAWHWLAWPWPAGGTPSLRQPWPLPGRSTVTCPRAAPRCGSALKMSEMPTRPQP